MGLPPPPLVPHMVLVRAQEQVTSSFSSAAEVAKGRLHGVVDKTSGSAENDLG